MAALLEGRPYTRADLEQTPDDGRRYELVAGVLVVSAAPGLRHQDAVLNLAITLRRARPDRFHVDTHVKRARFERAGIPSYWVVDPVARPASASAERSGAARERGSNVAPPDEASLVVWELAAAGLYREVAKATGDEAYQASLPFPVAVVPADLVR